MGRGRRRWAAGALLRGEGVTGVGRFGVPGLVLAWDLAQWHERGMCGSPERWIGAWSDLATARGGARPWGSPANEYSRSAGLRRGSRDASACVRVLVRTRARAAWGRVVLGGLRHGGAVVCTAAEHRGWRSGHQIGLHAPAACANGRGESGSSHRSPKLSRAAV